jgi:hypothetical protein
MRKNNKITVRQQYFAPRKCENNTNNKAKLNIKLTKDERRADRFARQKQ